MKAGARRQRKEETHTVDGNSNSLAQNVTIAALEGGDAAELIELAIVVAEVDALAWVGGDEVDLEVVRLGDDESWVGAWVALAVSMSVVDLQLHHCAEGRWG